MCQILSCSMEYPHHRFLMFFLLYECVGCWLQVQRFHPKFFDGSKILPLHAIRPCERVWEDNHRPQDLIQTPYRQLNLWRKQWWCRLLWNLFLNLPAIVNHCHRANQYQGECNRIGKYLIFHWQKNNPAPFQQYNFPVAMIERLYHAFPVHLQQQEFSLAYKLDCKAMRMGSKMKKCKINDC